MIVGAVETEPLVMFYAGFAPDGIGAVIRYAQGSDKQRRPRREGWGCHVRLESERGRREDFGADGRVNAAYVQMLPSLAFALFCNRREAIFDACLHLRKHVTGSRKSSVFYWTESGSRIFCRMLGRWLGKLIILTERHPFIKASNLLATSAFLRPMTVCGEAGIK